MSKKLNREVAEKMLGELTDEDKDILRGYLGEKSGGKKPDDPDIVDTLLKLGKRVEALENIKPEKTETKEPESFWEKFLK